MTLRCPFNDMSPCYGGECMLFLKLHENAAKAVHEETGGEVVAGMCSAAYIEDKPSFMMNVYLTEPIECKFEIPDGAFEEVM